MQVGISYEQIEKFIGTWYDEKDFYGKRIKYEEDFAKKNGMSHLVIGTVDSGRLDIAVKMKIHLRSAWWLTDAAKAAGKAAQLETAAFEFERRLRTDPHGFGELKYTLRTLGAPVHVGFVRPLAVEFSIHDEEHYVFVKRIEIMASLDP